MALISLQRKCERCSGLGELILGQNATPVVCPACEGTKLTQFAVSEELAEKLDAIIAEQAAQRVDLTAALLQIWNKVKTL